MALVLKLVLYGFITIAHASSLTITPRQHTDDRLAYIKNTFLGIYWDEANLYCSGDEFNILHEATRMLAPFTDVFEARFDETAAWNRFFVTDKKAKKGQGWHDTANNQNAFLSIKSNLVQLNKWPSRGKKTRQGKHLQRTQVTYTCKAPTGYQNKCNSPTTGAFMVPLSGYPGGWAIVFCPLFFKKRYLNAITADAPKKVEDLASLYSYEHLLAHELLHCDIIGTKEPVDDMTGNIPGQRDGQFIYGASRCYDYAWYLTNRWFDRVWKWNEYVGVGWFGKRDVQDDGTQAITPDDLTSYPFNADEGKVLDGNQVPQFADSKNCQRTDTVLGTSYECAYVGEIYSDYVKGLTTPCDLS
ncbi:MAG: hypothetical protein L6R36_008108 [Xanthoria steineri]|nr:MAG: hypothetical protein L6R36_008108 [Xanthoria steineri]